MYPVLVSLAEAQKLKGWAGTKPEARGLREWRVIENWGQKIGANEDFVVAAVAERQGS
jgi:hypothetical protein